MGPIDPQLREIAEAAGVRPPHVFHYIHAVSAPGFNPAEFADFCMLKPEHIERIGAEVKRRGINLKKPQGTRLTADFKTPPDWLIWAQGSMRWEAKSAQIVADEFKDYWSSKPGKDGCKLDWQATWRNWVRGSRRKPDYEEGARPASSEPIQWTPEERRAYLERTAALYDKIGRGDEAKELRRGISRQIGAVVGQLVFTDSALESNHAH